MKVLTTGIASLAFSYYATEWGVLMAGATLSVLSLIIVFLVAQRLLVILLMVTPALAQDKLVVSSFFSTRYGFWLGGYCCGLQGTTS
jgi:ABC-type maltose transport system permease subunit